MNATQLLAHFDRLSEAPGVVPRLRRFILDLAVRGKLVEQDAKDEPASILLKRIQTEQSKQIVNGEVRRQKALDETTAQDAPFVCPSTWQWTRLGLVANITQGFAFPSENFSSDKTEGLPLIKIGDIGSNNPTVFVRGGFDETYVVSSGDLLLGLSGSIKCAVWRGPKSLLNQRIAKISAVPNGFDRDWLFLCVEKCIEVWIGETSKLTVQNVKAGQLYEAYVPVPPLPEQHRIVAKVDELMALCDQLEAAQQERERRRDRLAAASLQRLNQPAAATDPETRREHARFHLHHLPRLTTRLEHIKAMRKTISSLAIRGRLVKQDVNDESANRLLDRNAQWRSTAIKRKQIREPRKELASADETASPYPLPTSWAWARLGEVIYIQSGDGLTAANMKDGSVPVFGGNGINGNHDSFNIDEPTLVIGRVGYYCGSIHITPDKAWVTDNAFITRFCPDLFSLRFLALLLTTTNLKENEGATAQPVISGSKIYPIVVGIPPLAEQHRIVAKVDELMALCDQLEAQLATTQTDSRRLLEAVLDSALA